MDPRRLLPFLLALTSCVVVATAAIAFTTQRSAPPASSAPAPASEAVGLGTPRQVLAGWDSSRAAAWAAGDVVALRDLYVPGSPTGREDIRMLSAYVDRGLHVDGLVTQVLAMEVIEESDNAIVLRVTDRVVGGVALGSGMRAPLPRDRPTTHTVTMRRVGGEWRIWAVRDQASAAASTSRTSTS